MAEWAVHAWHVCLGAPLATCALPKGVCYLLTTYYLLVPGTRDRRLCGFLSGCPGRITDGGRCGRCHTPWQRSGLRRSPLAWRVAVGWRLEAGSSCARHPRTPESSPDVGRGLPRGAWASDPPHLTPTSVYGSRARLHLPLSQPDIHLSPCNVGTHQSPCPARAELSPPHEQPTCSPASDPRQGRSRRMPCTVCSSPRVPPLGP